VLSLTLRFVLKFFMKKSITKYIPIILISALLFVIGYSLGTKSNISSSIRQTSVFENTLSISFDFGSGSDVVVQDIPIVEGATLYDILFTLNENGDIEIAGTDYGKDLGFFLESINGIGGDDGMWWQYWVNNSYSQVGVSSYIVQPGDVIRFDYAGDNFDL